MAREFGGYKMSHGVDWVVDLLGRAESVDEVELALRSSARAAVDADGATVVRREGDECYYAQEDSMSPLWQGQRFPLSQCISGWAILHRQIVAIPDIRVDARIPHKAYRPTFVRSLVMVPIGTTPSAIGAIGAYWADEHVATDAEVSALHRLADAAAGALIRIGSAPPPEWAGSCPRER
jgi:GAF domain-containing protein